MKGNEKHTPSEYQMKIYDFVEHGIGNAVISAKAGSAKTTTLVNLAEFVKPRLKCLFVAFNKSIAEELTEKLKDKPNCNTTTVHGLGLSIIVRNLDVPPIHDNYKYRNYLKNNACSLSKLDCENLRRSDIDEYIEVVTNLIDLARCNLCKTKRDVEIIAKKYSLPCIGDECEVVIKCLEWGKTHLETIDFMDMVWLPNELNMKVYKHKYDWIFIDEVQDYSLAYAFLMLRCFKRGTRFVCAGDEHQMINSFAGSSLDAFEMFEDYPLTQKFDLPICYRCDRKIVEMAQRYVPDIKVKDNAEEGEILEDCRLSVLRDGDMVLCRYMAPLFKAYVKLLKDGKKCYIKGQDEDGGKLIDRLNTIDCEYLGKELMVDGVFIRLLEKLIDDRNTVMNQNSLDLQDATLSDDIMQRYDMFKTLLILAEDCNTKTELIEKIKTIFVEDGEGICLSTIHKAKGLESDRAFILCRSCMPPKRATKDWEIEEEMNLIYVACTRPKHTLGFVSEKEVPPSGALLNDENIMADFIFYERRVCSVLGREMTKDVEHPEYSRFRLKAATKIEDPHKDDNVKEIGKRNEVPEKETSLDDLLAEFTK